MRLRQSLAELTFRAGVLCQHIDELRDQTLPQITKLNKHFKQTQLYGKSIVPLYDMERLSRFVHNRLAKFNASLVALSKEKRRFEAILRHYESTLHHMIKEVFHG